MKNKRNKIIMAAAVFATALIIGIGGNQNAIAQSKKNISEEAAKNIALKDAKLKASKVSFVKVKLDREDGKEVYDIEFYSGNKEFDYEIDALTGEILEKDTDIENFSVPKKKEEKGNSISLSKAKEIALKDAKLKGKKVSYVKAKKEKEDGRWSYNIEFYYGNKEYDYEIDALTGKILEKDLDIESFELPSKKDKNLISKEKAKDLAISHAKIKNTDVESFKIKNDIENGKPVYEIKLYTKNYEYDFELDAKTGEVLSFEKDALDENDD